MARERRQRQGQSRREREAAGDRTERMIYVGAAAVLALVVVIVLVGLYITRWLPPRAHVLTIEDARYSASDFVDRGAYLVVYQGGVATASEIAQATLDRLIQEETLRRRGPALVGEVTELDLERALRARLGFDASDLADEPEPGGTPGAAGTATPAATATATATATIGLATYEPEAYAREYQRFLQRAGISRDQYERIVEAQIVRERLEEHFEEEIGEAAPQVNLARIRVTDFALVEVIRNEVAEGGDFAELARRHSIDENREQGGELGWRAVPLLEPNVADAVQDLEPGDVSEAVQVGAAWDLYLVRERDDERELDATMRLGLLTRRIDAWLDEERQALVVEQDLSADEEQWINEHALSRARDLASRLSAGPG